MSGWISLHRKIMDHPFYTEKRKFSRYEAWIDLIMLANHQDNKFMLGNQLVEVKRGSFITSELKLMDKWDWGKEKLRGFLRLLESEQMIIKEASKYTLITICNYEKHSSKSDHDEASDSKGSEDQADRQQTDSRPTADRRPYTNNNVNNVNNKKPLKPSSPKQVFDEQSYEFRLSKYLYFSIIKFKPDLKEPNLQTWSKHIDYLIRLDNRDPKEIGQVIDWVTTDSFWQSVILSTENLRGKWDKITAKMKQGNFKSTNKQQTNLQIVQPTDQEREELQDARRKQQQRNGIKDAVNI